MYELKRMRPHVGKDIVIAGVTASSECEIHGEQERRLADGVASPLGSHNDIEPLFQFYWSALCVIVSERFRANFGQHA